MGKSETEGDAGAVGRADGARGAGEEEEKEENKEKMRRKKTDQGEKI
jgi:hypothetical protein